MKIDLKKIVELESNNLNALPVHPVLFDEQLIFGINIESNIDSIPVQKPCCLVNLDTKDYTINWKLELTGSEVKTKPKELCGIVFICTDYELIAIDKTSGEKKWNKIFKKHTDPEISVINDRLFFSNWGEIQEINPENGKKIISKKPRVKWFDSEIVVSNNRFFVSTSNSKILELSSLNLEVLNQYKYPGGWAMGCCPFIFENKLVSSSYAGKIISFDLETNLPVKRMNKKAGSKPQQLIINQNGFFYEGHLDNKLTCYDLSTYKKKWSNQIERIQALQNVDKELFIVFKENENYVVGKVEIKTGKVIEIVEESEFSNWSLYKWDLWQGIAVETSKEYLVLAYEPNKISIIKRN